MRQRRLFADVVGLLLDATLRCRQVYVADELPVRVLTISRRNAAKTLSMAALRLRTPHGLADDATVDECTRTADIEVIDLTILVPHRERACSRRPKPSESRMPRPSQIPHRNTTESGPYGRRRAGFIRE